ncbi:scaffold attachment factor B2-like [Pteropus vampyrus]|uniref:Scaffold attachment factor B2-like n=1 Tax=Pteropus vampyrus TaxID=132908 RepID=A0A6P3RZ66_PTEVA|nr:scaffold attachment factor B2-like [Pteropus vampyrus]
MDASLESLQNIDMMDVSVLEEAEVENSNAPDFGEDGTDSILDALCESKEYVAAQLRELPAQLPEHAVDGEGFESTLDASSLDFRVPPVRDHLVVQGWEFCVSGQLPVAGEDACVYVARTIC